MTTIAELLKEIDKNCAELKKAISELHEPIFLIPDDEAVEQVEQERNKDHYEAEQI